MPTHHLDDTNAPEHCSTTLHKQFTERLPNPPDLEYFHTPTPSFFLFSVLALGDRLGGWSALALGVLSAASGGRCLLLRSLPVSYTHLDVYKRQVYFTQTFT